MPRSHSRALDRWNQSRRGSLDSLESVHSTVTGGRRGRQYATEQLNLALFVSLAAEFQGYCRDLHDDAAFAFTDRIGSESDRWTDVVRSALVRGRKLDQGNAHPSSLGSDFQILGLDLWRRVHVAYPNRGKKWNESLTALNIARNAIAHRNDAQLAAVKAAQPLNLASFRRWRRSLDGAATGFDNVVGAYLTETIGASWRT
ncbi:hypothetical protein ACFWUP_26150 [Nocardia sp. NPDC058658]|uniref:hypothetical protein n=1 Tax=Nocardia sp. NPDC058658 TaxID=3346580 RepID=UPI00365D158D